MYAAIPFPDISNDIFSVDLGFMVLTLRWYALAYLVGIIAGWRIVLGLMRRPMLWPDDKSPTAPERIDDLLTAIILGVILGGRLVYVFVYNRDYYLAHPGEIMQIWQGGMAFHGGFLGVVVAGLWFCRRYGVPRLQLADALALVAPIGLFFGRIANFVNAELWGRPTEQAWGVIFPGEAAQDCAGIVAGTCARHPSQLYEAGLEGLILGLVLFLLFRRGALKRPGLITGVFLIGYGLSRFAVEFVRQADAQFITPDNPMGYVVHLGGLGLSMGQLLSLPMIVAGIWLWRKARA
ncbi:MAG: prolipoprotein diacylglyceryl transferase [Albidovulum sp.]|uniref:prolipoprotein diacylglyceryl transferase n=1 Tax=Albidovulum sp. TaxID=1872424 RepID=UPI003C9D54A4